MNQYGLTAFLLVEVLGCAKSPVADGATASGTGSGATSGATEPKSVDEGCPKDLLAARGTSCRTDGKACTAGPGQFTHLLMCSRGKWTEMDAPPPPPPPKAAPAVSSRQ